MRLRRAAVWAGLLLAVGRCEAALSGGTFSIVATRAVTSGAVSLSGGAWQLTPQAGSPFFGLSLSGGGLSVTPGQPIPSVTQTAAANLSSAHAYPVPYRPAVGHTKITFADLTQAVNVTVYNIKGEQVKSLSKSDSATSLAWDPVANDAGQMVASGLYLFIIKDSATGEKKTGKLIIIR